LAPAPVALAVILKGVEAPSTWLPLMRTTWYSRASEPPAISKERIDATSVSTRASPGARSSRVDTGGGGGGPVGGGGEVVPPPQAVAPVKRAIKNDGFAVRITPTWF